MDEQQKAQAIAKLKAVYDQKRDELNRDYVRDLRDLQYDYQRDLQALDEPPRTTYDLYILQSKSFAFVVHSRWILAKGFCDSIESAKQGLDALTVYAVVGDNKIIETNADEAELKALKREFGGNW